MMQPRTAPLTPADVNNEIWRLIKRCDEVVREIYAAGDKYAEAKGQYEDQHAQAVLKATGTIQEKKARADRECFSLYKEFLKADVRYKYLKSVLETTRSQLSAAQSVGSNMRDEWSVNKQYKT
jgi:hypothetical protein